jgi:trk system potassium uptake protein
MKFFRATAHDARPLFLVTGWILITLSVGLFLPAFLATAFQESSFDSFVMTSFLGVFIGSQLVIGFGSESFAEPTLKQGLLLTLCSWCITCFFGALPFYFSGMTDSLTDAVFESVSALTTTGISLLTDQHYFSESLRFWRAFLQWIGGFGIILMAMTLLPLLKIGGAQLMVAEFSDRSEKIFPRASQVALYLIMIYVSLTFLGTLSLMISQLPFLDALYYSISAISTGGIVISSVPLSLLSGFSKMILILLMVLGGSTLVHLISLFRRHPETYFQDEQIQGYYKLIGFSIFACFFWHLFQGSFQFWDSIFWTVSAVSTTGYSFTEPMGPFLSIFFILLAYLGGCSGSTSGGLKVFRAQILYRVSKAQVAKMLKPYGVFLTLYNGHVIDQAVVMNLVTTVFFYVMGWFLIALIFSLYGHDFSYSLSLSASLISNSGFPAIGAQSEIVQWSEAEKWLSVFAMLCGRFEFMTLIAVFYMPFLRR